jgi:hypothetical protein
MVSYTIIRVKKRGIAVPIKRNRMGICSDFLQFFEQTASWKK